jgi:hypothetical protein
MLNQLKSRFDTMIFKRIETLRMAIRGVFYWGVKI